MITTLPSTGTSTAPARGRRRAMSYRVAFLLLGLLLLAKVGFGQTYFAPLYSETFGTPASNLNIFGASQYTGFQNYLGASNPQANYITAGYAGTTPTARTTTPSSTYAIPAILNNGSAGTFSASGNAFMPGSATNPSGFIIQNINTSAVPLGDELWLGFGGAKTASTSLPSVDWSSDGTSWNAVSVSFVATTTWTYYTFQLPNGAKTANLRIRFTNGATATSQQMRFDDVRIARFIPAAGPSMSVNLNNLNKMYATTTIAGDSSSFTISGTNLTANVTVSSVTGFEFSTDASTWGSSVGPFAPSGGSVAQRVYVRKATGSLGAVSGTLSIATTGVTTVTTTLYGEVMNTTASAFGSNNLIVSVLGDANFNQGTTANPVASPYFLQEITKAGAAVQRVPMPFVTNGANKKVTVTGRSTTSAQLNLSPDQKYLTAVGYAAPVGTAATVARTSATYPKIVARIDYNGNINSTTQITGAFQTGDIRSAVTTDGTKMWAGGNSTSPKGGVQYVTLGSSGASADVLAASGNSFNERYVNITNSQLFVGSGSSPYIGINTVGSGLPTSGPVTWTNIAGSTLDPYGFVFADQSPSVPGNDVMYVADGDFDGLTSGLYKFYYNGTTWVQAGRIVGDSIGNNTSNVYNVYAEDNGASVDVYFSTNDKVFKITDASTQTGNITGNGTLISSLTPIYTATAGQYVRGIVGTPQNVLTADVNHTFTSSAISLPQSSTRKALYRIQLDVTTATATLSGITATTAGTYTSGDIAAFKLIRSSDATLDPGDAEFATISSTGSGETLTFSPAEAFTVGTHYVFIAADISGCATVGHTVSINSIPLANITYFSANTTGTPAAGVASTISAGTPPDVTNLLVAPASAQLGVSWTNAACGSQVLVVASTSPSFTAPNGAATYTADPNFGGIGSTIGSGKVVYQGTGTSVNITGLMNGQLYYVMVYNKLGSAYSVGVQGSGTPVQLVYYSQGSGASSASIWATSPVGTPGPATFSATSDVVVQNGNSVTFSTSTTTVRNMTVQNGGSVTWSGSTGVIADLTVQGGGTFSQNQSNLSINNITVNTNGTYTTNASAASPVYLLLKGNITNNGIFGVAGTAAGSGIGLSPEVAVSNITANQPMYFGRMSKRNATVPTVAVNFLGTAVIGFNFSGNVMTPNVASRTNITIAAGAKVSALGALGLIGIDGSGNDAAEKSGDIVVNGTLDAGRQLWIANNNTTPANTTGLTIGASGVVLADSIVINQTTTAPSTATINNGGVLKVRRHLQLMSGNLGNGVYLANTNGVTGRIGALGGGQTIGTITFERKMPATNGWHFVGAPIKGAFLNQWAGLGARISPPNNANFFRYDEADSSRVTYNGHLTEVNGWHVGPILTSPINPSDVITGYRIYTNANQLMSISGTPYIGNVLRGLTFSPATGYGGGGWNLIANPYPSEIDWNAVKTTNSTASLTSTYYVWNGSTQNYATYTVGLGGTNGGSRYIPSGQGFFAKVTAGVGLNFLETHKASQNTTFLRQGEVANRLSLTLAQNGRTDEAVVVFNADATEGFDGTYDAYKMDGSYFNLSTLAGSDRMALNAQPELTASRVIPVSVKNVAEGTYTLRFAGMDSFDASLVVYLRDNFLGTLTDLSTVNTYTFDVTSNPATAAARFELVAGPASVTAIAAKQGKAALMAFPNPAHGAVRLSATGVKGDVVILSIIGVDGRTAYTTKATVTNGTVDSSVNTALQAGVYTVRLTASGQTITTKLVVE